MADLVKSSKKTIYCQYLFIESIYNKSINSSNSDDNVVFFDVIRDSIIYFDKSEEEIKSHEKSNPYISKLLKMDVNGECYIDWQENELKVDQYVKDYKDTDGIYDFSPILFIYQIKKQQKSNNNLCQKYSSKYGLMTYDQDSFQNMEFTFEDTGYAVKRNSTDGWEYLLGTKTIYGNSLVIIDDFLLKDTKTYDNNLYKLLDVLLPWDIEIPFYLTFICGECNEDFTFRYKMIYNKIAELRPRYFKAESNYNGLIKINIIKDKNNVFHDRAILTNYCWISCGSGFDLYKESQHAKFSTNVSIIYPFIQSHVKWAKDSYLNFLCDSRDVYCCAQRRKDMWYESTLFKNRLFMMDTK